MTREALAYKKEFDPQQLVYQAEAGKGEAGDKRVPVYVYQDDIILAVNVALATRRPLLVRGPSGCGKSSLARNVADLMKWRYYETVVTSRTQARDLCWEVDLLRRLSDAQSKKELTEDYTPYIIPRVLWWAFDRESARHRGGKAEQTGVTAANDPCEVEHPRAVILIDEIDKADPDVPNNLLVPLGSLQFQVEETGVKVCSQENLAPLVFLTTNDERELPAAFLRRCVELKLELPTRKRLVEIGKAHFPNLPERGIKDVCRAVVGEAEEGSEERCEISPAEFIDTLEAYHTLGITPGSEAWGQLCRATVWKHGRKAPTS